MFKVKFLLCFVIFTETFCCTIRSFGNETVIKIANGTFRQVRSKIGCITDENSTIWRIEVENEVVPILFSNAIAFLPKLRRILFKKNKMNHIHAYAFYKLYKLEEVIIEDNNIATVVNSVFKNSPVITISLRNNRLKCIEDEAFENLLSLNTLDLSLNQLQEFNTNWFLNTPNVEILALDDNKIAVLQENAFSNLVNLKNLSIGHNDLQFIHGKAFTGLRKLRSLDVSGNKIKKLEDSTFIPFKRLVFLSLNGNLFMYFSDTLLNDLRSLEVLHIHDNPWTCGCYDKINNCAVRNDWQININLRHCYNTSITTPVCVATVPPTTKCIENYDEGSLQNYIEHADSRIWYLCPRPKKAPLSFPALIPPVAFIKDENGNFVGGATWEYI